MKLGTLWFAAKLATAFSGLGILTLVATVLLFRYAAGGVFREQGEHLLEAEAALRARMIEERLGAAPLDPAPAQAALDALPTGYGDGLAVLAPDGDLLASAAPVPDLRLSGEERQIACGARQCVATSHHPGWVLRVPLQRDGERVGTLAVTQGPPHIEEFWAFALGLLAIHFTAILLIVLLSIRITGPLRTMSRSMDRIASGDLGHRVEITGRDEIGRMGRSFNSMADRLEGMVLGSKELLAGVSHELRSPLGRMKLSVEMLRESGADEGHLRSIDDDVETLDAMVDELLTASRLDLGTQALEPVDVEVEELVRTSWKRVEGRRAGGAPPLETHISPEGLTVRVDRTLGVRLLGNLFENAARYGEGSAVELRAHRDGAVVHIEVADHGPGVPPDQLESLFLPFFRADTSRSRKTGGSGLGLMIVRRAVEAHGGTVAAANAPGSGLVVTVTLPSSDARPAVTERAAPPLE